MTCSCPLQMSIVNSVAPQLGQDGPQDDSTDNLPLGEQQELLLRWSYLWRKQLTRGTKKRTHLDVLKWNYQNDCTHVSWWYHVISLSGKMFPCSMWSIFSQVRIDHNDHAPTKPNRLRIHTNVANPYISNAGKNKKHRQAKYHTIKALSLHILP